MHRFLLLTAAVALVGGLPAGGRAAWVATGNPATDANWSYRGYSLENANDRSGDPSTGYIRGTANFGYNLYSSKGNTSSVITAGDGLNVPVAGSSPGWAVGNKVIAMGGVIANTQLQGVLGWTATPAAAFPNGVLGPTPVNSNLTGSVRLVGKFHAGASTWGTSSRAPGFTVGGRVTGGNGLGDFSAGQGGIGSILIGTAIGDLRSTQVSPGVWTNENAGKLLTPAVVQRFGATGVTDIAPDVGRYIFQIDPTTGLLRSWQMFLNYSLIAARFPDAGPADPSTNTVYGNLALQRGSNAFTDAQVTISNPAPPTLVAGLVGAGLAGLVGVRRRLAARA